MTEKEIRSWMLRENISDQWWMSLDDETQEEPVPLQAAADLAAEDPEREVQVLHVSRVGDKEPPWVLIEPDSVMSAKDREELRPAEMTYGIGILIQLFVILIIIGAVAYFIWPSKQRSAYNVIDGYNPEVLIEDLGRVTPDAVGQPPTLGATVARTKRMLYIINKSDRTWTQCQVTLNEADGYRFIFFGDIPPEKTLPIPLRKFTRDGQQFTAIDAPITRIYMEVPGFQTYDKAFEPNSP
ncbi:MAG: hypothetical protein AAGF10_03920 [Verrucomicrobiota bacterium]